MTIFRLSLANMKKKKSLTGALILLSFLAAFFFNIGLTMLTEMDRAYEERAEAMNSPDFFVMSDNAHYRTEFEAFLLRDDRVGYVEKEEVIYMENCENSANSLKLGAVFFNRDAARKIEPFHLLEHDDSVPEEDAVYLPVSLKSSGISLGDHYTIRFKNLDFPFRVAGFFESTYYGTSSNAFLKYYIPEETFKELYLTAGSGTALSAKLADGLSGPDTAKALLDDFLDAYHTKIGGLLVISNCFSAVEIKEIIMALQSVPMTILIAFSFLIFIIVSLVVYFKVREEIHESLPDIGSLQAMGYTTKQIMLSVIEEFGADSLIGGITGTVLSRLTIPLLTGYGEKMIGLSLSYQGTLSAGLVSSLSVFLLTSFSAAAAAYKLRKIPPVAAFRKGVENHHFAKNYFSLFTGTGGLYYRLALKNMAANLRQNITVTSVIFLGVFAMGLTIILYMNLGYDHSAIPRMTGMEVADIQITLLPHADPLTFREELRELDEVRKVNSAGTELLKTDGEWALLVVSPNLDEMETITAARGDIPVYDNEIALSSFLLNKLGKEIGDTVAVEMNGISAEYLITGETMGTNNGGKMGMLSLDGIRRLSPHYMPGLLYVYLKDPAEPAGFLERMYSKYGTADSVPEPASQPEDGNGDPYTAARKKAENEIKLLLRQYGAASVEYAVMLDGEIILSGGSSDYKIKEMVSLTEYLDGQLKSYNVMLSGLAAMILGVMLLIIGSILSITIRSMLRRQKEELGVYKALGYTTGDLVQMISIQFLFHAVCGAILGIFLCRLTASRIFNILFKYIGVGLVNLKVSLWWLAGVGLAVVVFVCLLSAWKAYQVRKISVYELLTE